MLLQLYEALIVNINHYYYNVLFKEQHPTKFEKLTRKINEGIFSDKNKEWYENYYKNLTKNTLEMVTKSINPESEYVKRMKQFIDPNTFFDEMITLVNTTGPLSVICHGDCWTNNFLYKYGNQSEENDGVDGNGRKIEEMQFVDFQLIRYGSLTLDIVNLLYCCTDQNLRQKHMPLLLKLYKRELIKSLKLLGPELPEFCRDEEEFTKL